MSASDDLVTIDFSQAPLAIKITALGTVLGGIAAILVGILFLFQIVQNEPLVGIILAIIGIVMIIAGLGLYRLWKPAWILYIIVAVVLLLVLIGALGLDKILIALLMIFISLILGDLLAENEYFLRPDQREGVSTTSKTVRQKKTSISAEPKTTRPKPKKKAPPKPKAKSEEFVDDYLGEDSYRDEDSDEEYDMIDMIQDETYDEDEWERKE